MFLIYSLISITLSLGVAFIVVRLLRQPLERILHRVSPDDTWRAWLKYIKFAIYVASLSGGASLSDKDIGAMEYGYVDVNLLGLKLYVTALNSLRGIFYVLAYIFLALAVAFVVVRAVELIKARSGEPGGRA